MQKSVVILFLLFIALSSCQSGQKQKPLRQQKKESMSLKAGISDFMQGVLLEECSYSKNQWWCEFGNQVFAIYECLYQLQILLLHYTMFKFND